MSKWNKFQSKHKGKPMKEVSRLYKLSNERTKKSSIPTGSRKLIPLTISILRERFWDKKKNKGKAITLYIGQTYGGKGINGKVLTTKTKGMSQEIFVPGGHLIHEWGKNIYPATTGPILSQHTEIIENWLSKSNSGPYSPKDKGKGSKDFYYLTGYYKRKDRDEHTQMQVCSGPLNVLSTDCLDEVNCYIAV